MAQHDPQVPWFWQNWFCAISERFHVILSCFGLVVLEKKILKIFFCINTCENTFPKCDPTPSQRLWACLVMWFLTKRFWKYFPLINICKNSFPYSGPIWPPKAMIFTNLILYMYYVRNPSCIFHLFWPCGSWEEHFWKHFSYINTCINSFAYCGPTWPPGVIILTNLALHYVRKHWWKFDLYWLSGPGEDFKMTPQYFCIFVIISPFFEETLFEQTRNPFT
jgi:hypothetical protein